MEKALTIVATLGVLAAIGLLVGLIVVLVKDDATTTDAPQTTTEVQPPNTVEPQTTTLNPLDGICLSQSCIHESSTVLAQMNLAADP